LQLAGVFGFSANDSSIEQVCPSLVDTMCKDTRSDTSSRALATFQIIGKARKQGAI